MTTAVLTSLLTSTDPPPVDVVHGESDAPLVLVCEHAGKEVPAALGDLGVQNEVLNSHRGWDIGAGEVAIGLARRLRAPLILQRYSRLVIDANRPPTAPSSIPEVSDGEPIPGNQKLTVEEKENRVRAIFDPMERAIEQTFSSHRRLAAFSIHSFTPRYAGSDRKWHAGFLSRKSLPTAKHLMSFVAAKRPELTLALNQPYQIEDDTDWFIPAHAEKRTLRHCLIEIRNDQIEKSEGAAQWAELLAAGINDVLGDLT